MSRKTNIVQPDKKKDIASFGKNQDNAPTIKKKKQNISLKNVLCTPYNIQWPKIESNIEFSILNELQKVLSKYNLRKPRTSKCSSKKSGNKPTPDLEERTEDEKNLKSQLVCGINEVTKHLEKDNLRLILIDKFAFVLTRHLIQLSGVRDCSAIALGNLTKTAAPLLSVTQLSCIGFRKIKADDNQSFNSLVNLVENKCSKVELPWLSFEEWLKVQSESDSDSEESKTNLQSKTKILDCTSTNKCPSRVNSKNQQFKDTNLEFIPFGSEDSFACKIKESNKAFSSLNTPEQISNCKQRKRKSNAKDQQRSKVKRLEENNSSNYQTLNLHKMQGNINKVKRKKKKK